MSIEYKDPAEVADYEMRWATHLGADTIDTSTWEVDPATITVDSDTNTTTTATVWLSGGAEGGEYKVTNEIVTAAGRTLRRYFWVRVEE